MPKTKYSLSSDFYSRGFNKTNWDELEDANELLYSQSEYNDAIISTSKIRYQDGINDTKKEIDSLRQKLKEVFGEHENELGKFYDANGKYPNIYKNISELKLKVYSVFDAFLMESSKRSDRKDLHGLDCTHDELEVSSHLHGEVQTSNSEYLHSDSSELVKGNNVREGSIPSKPNNIIETTKLEQRSTPVLRGKSAERFRELTGLKRDSNGN